MAQYVNLLLLLSALLSALTGGASAMRTPAAAHAVASAAVAMEAGARPTRIACRPQQDHPSRVAVVSSAIRLTILPIVAAAPLYASRLRI